MTLRSLLMNVRSERKRHYRMRVDTVLSQYLQNPGILARPGGFFLPGKTVSHLVATALNRGSFLLSISSNNTLVITLNIVL